MKRKHLRLELVWESDGMRWTVEKTIFGPPVDAEAYLLQVYHERYPEEIAVVKKQFAKLLKKRQEFRLEIVETDDNFQFINGMMVRSAFGDNQPILYRWDHGSRRYEEVRPVPDVLLFVREKLDYFCRQFQAMCWNVLSQQRAI